MSIAAYWPVRDEINRCIKAEAEAAPDAVLMAVHQPMPLVRREFKSPVETPANEQELLDAFLSDDLAQGTLLMAITGPSGVGKSHLIRWLAAQLGRDPRARHLYVIRIPKSANLRRVLELMLEPLASDPRFAEVLASLHQAVDAVEPEDAGVRFAAALEIALKALAKRLRAELAETLNDAEPLEQSERRALQSRIYHAENLPGLFNDAELRDHMIRSVLAPIIQRAVAGRKIPERNETEAARNEVSIRSISDQENAERLYQFRAADLELPDSLRGALGAAAKTVRTYYTVGLNRADGEGREEAVAILNEVEVVDQAISQVFGLHQAIRGVTLLDIILRIRELMFQDGRELVLLVEDFAALGGIQQVLLDVCITQAINAGQQTLSRMRTALALTDGYLVARDTIASRAIEYVIQSRVTQNDVVGRTIELAGAYLNAARWGEDELTSSFHESARGTDLTGWVEVFEDPDQTAEDSDQLKAFGRSRHGIPLFPFNESALRSLAERHLREAGELRFNPRLVINFILRDALLMRDDFERRVFPPPGFKGASLSAAPAGIANWLNKLTLGEEERGRLASLLVYWGGNPQTAEQAGAMAPELFEAFGLRRPDGLPASSPVVTPEPPQPDESPEPKPPAGPEDPFVADWRQKFDAWAAGPQGELTFADANFLRKTLKGSLENAIPWNLLRLRKRSVSFLLTIPNARGNDAGAGICLPVAADNSDPTGELRLTLLGAIRLDRAQGQLNYLGADEDSARVATLVERLVSHLIPHLEELRDREVKALAWALTRQARLLGLVPRERVSRQEARTRAILTPGGKPVPDGPAPVANESNWQRLRHDAATHRPDLLRMLHERIGCFQGSGPTAYAVDPTLIGLAEPADSPDLNVLSDAQRQHCRQLTPARLPAATRPQVETLRKLSSRLAALLEPECDKKALETDLKDLIEALRPVGAWPDGYTPQGFRNEITRFGQDSLKAQLDEAGPLLDANNPPDLAADGTLERLGRIDFAVIDRAGTFLDRAEAFVTGAEKAIKLKEQGLGGVDPKADAEALAQALDQIHRDLLTLAGREVP
jgi:hypothetical protein